MRGTTLLLDSSSVSFSLAGLGGHICLAVKIYGYTGTIKQHLASYVARPSCEEPACAASKTGKKSSNMTARCELDSDLHDSAMGFSRCIVKCEECTRQATHTGCTMQPTSYVDFPGSPWALYSSKCGGLPLLLPLGPVSTRAHDLDKTVPRLWNEWTCTSLIVYMVHAHGKPELRSLSEPCGALRLSKLVLPTLSAEAIKDLANMPKEFLQKVQERLPEA